MNLFRLSRLALFQLIFSHTILFKLSAKYCSFRPSNRLDHDSHASLQCSCRWRPSGRSTAGYRRLGSGTTRATAPPTMTGPSPRALRLSSGLPRRLLRPSPTTWYLYSFFFFLPFWGVLQRPIRPYGSTVALPVFFTMDKMVIFSKHISWKKFPPLPIKPKCSRFIYFSSYITTISFYIFDNT
jgi:hypothetical protein